MDNPKGKAVTFQEARVSQVDVKKIYDKNAGIYDVWGKATETKARNRAIELAGIRDGQSIVEVAVGTGLAFYEIVKRNLHGTNIGIDLSERMLGQAEKKLQKLPGANYRLQIGSAFQLEFENESADLLVNNYMFDLIPFGDMAKIIEEFRRVLKQDGKLILVNMTIGEKFGSGLYEMIYKFFPSVMGACRGVRLAEKLETLGFEVKVREYYQQLLFPSEVILAIKK